MILTEATEFTGRKTTGLQNGFTLIEIMVALVILTVLLSAALDSQLFSVKIEKKARALQSMRCEIRRIYSVIRRSENAQQTMEELSAGGGCEVKAEPVQFKSGTNVITMIKCELKAREETSSRTVLFTDIPVRLIPPEAAPPGAGPRSKD